MPTPTGRKTLYLVRKVDMKKAGCALETCVVYSKAFGGAVRDIVELRSFHEGTHATWIVHVLYTVARTCTPVRMYLSRSKPKFRTDPRLHSLQRVL